MTDNNEKLTKVGINWYPGHMAKTKKQIADDLKLIDVVIELLDARIPISSQNPDIQELTNNKKKVIVLNKADLADEVQTKRWIEYFKKKQIPAVMVDANSGKGIKETVREVEKIMKDTLNENAAKGRVGRSIRAIVLGIPNVGKSSFINRISKKTSAMVGNKPGVTRQKQWIRVADNIELLDTPGVLWPKFESEEVALNLAFTGTIKDDVIDKTEVAFYLLKYLLKYYPEKLYQRYNLEKENIEEIMQNEAQDENVNIMDVMYLIGKKRGAIVSGNNVDEQKVANILLDDFRTTKIGKITLEKAK